MVIKAVICAQCGCTVIKQAGAIERARKINAKLFCGKACFGLSRRVEDTRTPEQKRADKALYDQLRRRAKADEIKRKKANYYRLNHDREKEREIRKANMPRHVEYCRRPEYRQYKQQYDRKYRSNKLYGDFADAFLTLIDLETEISSRASKYEIYSQNGTLNKSLQRRRDYDNRNGNPHSR